MGTRGCTGPNRPKLDAEAREVVLEKFDPIIANFTYVRWLGDRKRIEEQTKVRDEIIIDRSADLIEWVDVLKTVCKRKIQILAFANNHYAGCGPGTVEQFREIWRKQVPTETDERSRAADQGHLFK